jgi:carbonyl reductase 1
MQIFPLLLPIFLFTTFCQSYSNMNISRTAIVTGANKGIGYHIAQQLASSGHFTNVVLACRDESRGMTAVKQIQDSVSNSNCLVSYEQLTIGDENSHERFVDKMKTRFDGKIDVLVNNAAMAFKNADPTPFRDQCKPTLDVNFRGVFHFTESMLPLVRKGVDPRIVNVASMAGRLSQLSPSLQAQFSDVHLTKEELNRLVDEFEHDIMTGNHKSKGWGNSNYGFSKLALIAATKIWAREEVGTIKVNAICPGYCDTDMTSHKGPRSPSEGAKNAVLPAIAKDCPTGEFFENMQVSVW